MTDPWWTGKSEEEVQAYLRQVRARADAQHVAELESALASTTEEFSWPPAPNTAHPSFARQAAFVRELMGRGEHTIMLAVERPLSASLFLDDPSAEVMAEAHRHTTLLVQRVMTSFAPWTERPYIYMWRVAVERATHRWVAGDSWAERPSPDAEWRAR